MQLVEGKLIEKHSSKKWKEFIECMASYHLKE